MATGAASGGGTESYPGATVATSAIFLSIIGFFPALLLGVPSLAVVAAPSAVLSSCILLSLRAMVPLSASSVPARAVLACVLTPLAQLNLLAALCPVVSGCFTLVYLGDFERASVPGPYPAQLGRRSTAAHAVVLVFSLGAAAFAALATVMCHVARPNDDDDGETS